MKSSLRFCMITTFYPPYSFGGDGVYVRSLSNELAARGHQVEVIFCKDAYRFLAQREPPSVTDFHPNITLHGLENPLGMLSPLISQQTGRPGLKRSAIEQVLSTGFDVIHFHNTSLIGGPDVLTYGEGIKLYTTHEYWLVCPMHVLYRYDRELCDKPDCLACTLSYGRPPQWWRYTNLLKSAARHVDRFIAPSRFTLHAHQERGFDFPMTHLPYFLPPPARFAEITSLSPAATDDPYFLFVGRLEKIKGLQTIIPVFRNHLRARLLIAGKGNYESELRALAGGSTKIQFLGYLSHDELWNLYAKATALIVPSLCYEVFGLVVVEAFMKQTPVIARDIGGLTEVVQDSEGGLLFQDDASLLDAIERLLSDRELRDRMGKRGFAAYQREWSPEVHVGRYFGILDEIEQSKQRN